jgi:hypothetical protein
MSEAPIHRRLTLEQAERMAIRHNARRGAKYPLRASGNLISQTSTEQILGAFGRWEESRKKLLGWQERLGVRCRGLVARRVGARELARLDCLRATLPRSSEYSADFWRTQLAQLCGRSADGRRQARLQQK